jgi:hypothetical protein
LIILIPGFHIRRLSLFPASHYRTQFDGLYDSSPSIADINIHIRQKRDK